MEDLFPTRVRGRVAAPLLLGPALSHLAHFLFRVPCSCNRLGSLGTSPPPASRGEEAARSPSAERRAFQAQVGFKPLDRDA